MFAQIGILALQDSLGPAFFLPARVRSFTLHTVIPLTQPVIIIAVFQNEDLRLSPASARAHRS